MRAPDRRIYATSHAWTTYIAIRCTCMRTTHAIAQYATNILRYYNSCHVLHRWTLTLVNNCITVAYNISIVVNRSIHLLLLKLYDVDGHDPGIGRSEAAMLDSSWRPKYEQKCQFSMCSIYIGMHI